MGWRHHRHGETSKLGVRLGASVQADGLLAIGNSRRGPRKGVSSATMGFDESNVDVLEVGLLKIAQNEDVAKTETTPYARST